MNYRTRLLLSISSVSILMLIFIALNSVFFLKDILSERVAAKIRAVGEILSEEISHEYGQKDFEGLRSVLRIARSQPDMRFISVVDDGGAVLFSSEKALEGRLNPYKDSPDVFDTGKDVFIESFPFGRADTALSHLQIGFSVKGVQASLRRAVRWSWGLSTAAFFLILGVAWFFSGRLLRPLEEMTAASNRIAEGDFSARLKTRTNDVVGQLGRSLNFMAGQLDGLTRGLQGKIEIATSQLAAANRDLQAKTSELEESNRRLVALDKLKSEFVSIVSHELRTPLTGIIGFAQTLQTIPCSEPQREKYLKIIEAEGKRLAYLVGEFLDISRIDSGNIDLQMEPVNLADVVRETVSVLRIPDGIHVECRLPDDPLPVEADRNRIKQVLMNIVDNALGYSPPSGTVTITGRSAGDSVVVSVQDEGPGISEEAMGRIFQKFYRGADEASRRRKGSGLGLAIAKGIIESHHGTVWVESEAGKGSTFRFSLPKNRKASHAAEGEPHHA
jgi:signal transduction histidine kinase